MLLDVSVDTYASITACKYLSGPINSEILKDRLIELLVKRGSKI